MPVLSPDCAAVYGDYANDNAVILGTMFDTSSADGSANLASRQAALLAATEINAGGELPPLTHSGAARPLVVVECDPTVNAVRTAQHLVNDLHVPAIVGPDADSDVINVTQQVSATGGTVLLSPSAIATPISQLVAHGLTRLMLPSDDQRAKLLVEQFGEVAALLASRGPALKLGVVYRTDVLGESALASISGTLMFDGHLITDPSNASNVSLDSYTDASNIPSQTAISVKYAALHPDVVFITAPEQVANVVIPLEQSLTLYNAPNRPYYILNEAAMTPAVLSGLSQPNVPSDFRTRVRGIDTQPESSSVSVRAAFDAAYASAYGSTPASPDVGASYDAMYSIAYAIAATPGMQVSGRALPPALACSLPELPSAWAGSSQRRYAKPSVRTADYSQRHAQPHAVEDKRRNRRRNRRGLVCRALHRNGGLREFGADDGRRDSGLQRSVFPVPMRSNSLFATRKDGGAIMRAAECEEASDAVRDDAIVQSGEVRAAERGRRIGLAVGDVVGGKYCVERILGEGGMGFVVAAKHIQLDEYVALKFLYDEFLLQPHVVERFTREAKAACKIKSEHVARVYDVGADNGKPFLVMEHLTGRDLATLLSERGRLGVEDAVEYAMQTCAALAAAHVQGIVHRDIKPENLFLVEHDGLPSVKLLDFGISKSALTGIGNGLEISKLTGALTLGTPLYMSPEQIRSSASADVRSDLWSLGMVLYELLTGTSAFQAEGVAELFAAVLERDPAPIHELRPEVPADLAHVVMRCLQKDPANRFQTAGELAIALLPFAPHRALAVAERAGLCHPSDSSKLWAPASARVSLPNRTSDRAIVRSISPTTQVSPRPAPVQARTSAFSFSSLSPESLR